MSARHIATRVVCALAIAALACRPACARAQTVRGTVLDPAGEPLDHAQIQLLPNGAHTVTGSDGRFDLGPLADGTYTIQVRRLGFQAQSGRFVVPLAKARLTFTLSPVPVLLDTIHTRLLEQELPRVFQRMQEHLGAEAFGPDLMKKYPGMSLDEILYADGKLWQQLAGAQFHGCTPHAFIDGVPVPPPLGTDWARRNSKSSNPASAAPIDLEVSNFVPMRDVAAVEVFNSPDFVHEPVIDVERDDSLGHTGSCQRIVMVWTNGYQQRPWAGH